MSYEKTGQQKEMMGYWFEDDGDTCEDSTSAVHYDYRIKSAISRSSKR